MLGIIGAMDMEVDMLAAEMTDAAEERIGYNRFCRGRLQGVPVCLARCGVGKVHAALCAAVMIREMGVDAVLNVGVAGALDERLRIGDVVVADSAVQHDVDTSPLGDPPGMVSGPDMVHFPCDGAFRTLLDKAGAAAGLTVWHGAVATGDQFIAAEERKDFLRRHYDAAACDMEGSAIAQTCYEMGVPYAVCRAISDTRRGDGREYMEKARIACLREQALVRAFMALYAENGRHEHG